MATSWTSADPAASRGQLLLSSLGGCSFGSWHAPHLDGQSVDSSLLYIVLLVRAHSRAIESGHR